MIAALRWNKTLTYTQTFNFETQLWLARMPYYNSSYSKTVQLSSRLLGSLGVTTKFLHVMLCSTYHLKHSIEVNWSVKKTELLTFKLRAMHQYCQPILEWTAKAHSICMHTDRLVALIIPGVSLNPQSKPKPKPNGLNPQQKSKPPTKRGVHSRKF